MDQEGISPEGMYNVLCSGTLEEDWRNVCIDMHTRATSTATMQAKAALSANMQCSYEPQHIVIIIFMVNNRNYYHVIHIVHGTPP